MTTESLDAEVAKNYDYFQRRLAEFVREQAGRFALLRSAKVEEFFDSVSEADRAGWTRFPDRRYSIQQVVEEPMELGIYANGAD